MKPNARKAMNKKKINLLPPFQRSIPRRYQLIEVNREVQKVEFPPFPKKGDTGVFHDSTGQAYTYTVTSVAPNGLNRLKVKKVK